MEIRIESGKYKASYQPKGGTGNKASLSYDDLAELCSMIRQARSSMAFGAGRATLTLDDSAEERMND